MLNKRAVTLLELIFAIVLLSVVVLAMASIQTFSRYHVVAADRQVKVQSSAALVVEQVTKTLNLAIGNDKLVVGGKSIVCPGTATGVDSLYIYIDGDGDGVRSAPITTSGGPTTLQDRWVAYHWVKASHQLKFCNLAKDDKSDVTCGATGNEEIIASNIISFKAEYVSDASNNLTNNYVQLTVSARYDPTKGKDSDNPEITLQARVKMPSVSLN